MKTVFITGTSSGIGRETAKIFAENGWNVAATMRHPEKEKELTKFQNVRVFHCDVTDINSIETSIKSTISTFGSIDVVINNAGFYTVGIFENATETQISKQLDTNLKGSILVAKTVIPYLRAQKSGIIINLSSIAGLISIPLQTLYHATKWGIEGFSESLQYELKPFNIKVKLIEPGVIKTDFYGRSMTVTSNMPGNGYDAYSEKVLGNLNKNGSNGSSPLGVAQVIYKAATDGKRKMRYRVGNSKNMPIMRKLMPLKLYQKIVSMAME